MEPNLAGEVIYSEVVRPPVWLLAFILFLTESLALSLWAAFDNRVGAIAAIVGALIGWGSVVAMAMKIEVTTNELRVARAHIDRKYLGALTELDPTEMALTRGQEADPAAFLAIRFWQPRGIKIAVQDSRDATPYWLITTKKPAELARALNTN